MNFFAVFSMLLLLLFIYVLKKISEHEGGKYETAIYASQCSNLKRLLPICTEWEVSSPPPPPDHANIAVMVLCKKLMYIFKNYLLLLSLNMYFSGKCYYFEIPLG